jgi:hypothetical protein
MNSDSSKNKKDAISPDTSGRAMGNPNVLNIYTSIECFHRKAI